jgi:hypothetical protein
MPIDEPPDLLYRLIVHELTHQFQFDIIPTGLIRRNMPLWVFEGMSDYMTGYWRPLDIMTVRDAAVSDIVPKMSEMQDYGGFSNPRLIYNLGHAAFEFMESKWGKEGVRAYVFALRRSVIGGSDDAYQEAFQMTPEEWDQQFDRYLKERFKPFRDKERPADYGRDLAPDPRKGKFSNVLSIEPSPSGDLIAGMTGNGRDREYDIVLISAKDGAIIRNLTSGFDQSMGFEYVATPGGRWNSVPWMSWSPQGDRLAYFVRTEKDRSLIVQNVVSKKVEVRVNLTTIDAPESPDFSPDGKLVAFAGMRGSEADIFTVNLETKEIVNLTKDKFANYAPTWAPDGRSIVYLVRVSGNEKLFRMDANGANPVQLTFGTHDDGGAQFLDANTLLFASTAVNPAEPIEPDVAKNGQIYNIWTLDLKTNELKQFTDALSGNVSPVVLKDTPQNRVAFVTYFKGEYGLHVLERREEITKVASSDFGSPGPIVDFQAPLMHTLVPDNQKKKGKFDKLFLEGRPPVALGVTSGGDVFGGTQVTFTDVLGDQQFNLFISSVSQYRTMNFTWVNMEKRLQWALSGYNTSQFYYGQLEGVLYDPYLSQFIDRDLATATRTIMAARRSGSIRSTAIAASKCSAASNVTRRATTIRWCRRRRTTTRKRSTAGSSSTTATWRRSAWRSCRRRRSSASSGRCRAARCASRTRSRRRSPACCRGRPSTATRASTSASAPPACWRCAPAASRAWATTPISLTSVATVSCAVTNTCSSPARTRSSPMRNCASR